MGFRIGLLAAVALTAIAATGSMARAEEMQVAAADVEEIVITATARQQTIRNAPASISVITREDLERTPYREVTDALLEIPGVAVTPGEGNSRDISLRGMAPKYTLILVDGRRLSSRESRTNGGSISEGGLLPPFEAIERIEVVRGPMSSLYGSDAMGGVVNIITRRIGDVWQGNVRVNGTLQLDDDFGNFGDANFYVSGPLTDGLGLQVQGAVNRREEDRIIGGTPERRDDTISAKLGFDLTPDHRFLAEGGYFRQKVIATAGQTFKATAEEPAGTESTQTQNRYVGSLSHSGDWGLATSESYVQYEDAENVETEKRIKNTVGQSIWVVPLPSNMLSLGSYFRHEDLTDLTGNRLAGSTRTGASRTAWALFAEDELQLFDGFALTGGIRMDDDEQYGTNWTPRAYAVWNATDAITVKGGYSKGFRAPDLRQTLADWGQSSRGGNIYGNPNLEAETSRTYEVALLYTADGFQAGITAYDTRFNDKITRLTCVEAGAWCIDEPLSSLGRPPTTYINVDKARIRGIELTVSLPITEALRLDATGTLTDSEQLTGANAGSALNDTPKQQASTSLNWRPTSRFDSYIRAIYRGEEAVTEAQISGESLVAPAYTTVDVGVAYQVTPSLKLHGGIQNLFDERLDYEESAYVIDGARVWTGISVSF